MSIRDQRSIPSLCVLVVAALGLTACGPEGASAPPREAGEHALRVGLPTVGAHSLTWELRTDAGDRVLRLSSEGAVDRLLLTDGEGLTRIEASFDAARGVDVEISTLLSTSSAAAPLALSVADWPSAERMDAMLVGVALAGGLPVADEAQAEFLDRFDFVTLVGGITRLPAQRAPSTEGPTEDGLSTVSQGLKLSCGYQCFGMAGVNVMCVIGCSL